MKKLKPLIPAYVMSFVFSFMLYIFEPLTMYGNNVNDFCFFFYIMLPPIIVAALVMFFIISLGFTIVYFINKKFSDKLKVYNILFLIAFVCFLGFYIQGNYLIGGLPGLDGSNIDWSKYKDQEIISLVVYAVLTITVVLCSIKFKMKNVINVSTFISLTVFVMLVTGLVTTCTSNNLIRKKNGVLATSKNYNVASTDQNFYIFLVDAVDSVMFDKQLSKKEYKNTFKDFTYYKDTSSVYGYTRDSLPQILGGMVNDNTYGFHTYSTKAMDNSPLIKALQERDYDINIYDMELIWDSDKATEVSNLVKAKRGVDYYQYIKNQTKYVLFKYLPFSLKKYSKIETMFFNNSKVKQDIDYFTWTDWDNYDTYTNEEIQKVDNKYFHFIHLEGAHVPFGMCKDLTYNKKCGYTDKLQATIKIINAYLKRLKKYDVYDNASIIVLSDHGYVIGNKNGAMGRTNPILFIKGVDEHHDMIRSTKAVSYLDLDSAYVDLLDGKKSYELFDGLEYPNGRRVLWYKYTKENHMVEYMQTGKAWDKKTLKATGKEFNR